MTKTLFGILGFVGILVAAAVLFLPSSATRLPGDLPLFGLSSVCAPSGPARSFLVSPGQIRLDDGETLADVDFEVQTDGLAYQIGIAYGGVVAGDAISVRPDMSLDLEPPFDLSGPGKWPVVVVVDIGDGGAAEQGRLQIDSAVYSKGPIKYRSEDLFELFVLNTCSDENEEKWLERPQ